MSPLRNTLNLAIVITDIISYTTFNLLENVLKRVRHHIKDVSGICSLSVWSLSFNPISACKATVCFQLRVEAGKQPFKRARACLDVYISVLPFSVEAAWRLG